MALRLFRGALLFFLVGVGPVGPAELIRESDRTSSRTARGIIAGVVTSDKAGVIPVSRATVTLTDLRGEPRLTTSTDERGGFELKGVAAGRYMLVVEKPGFLSTTYGSTGNGSQGITFAVSDDKYSNTLRVVLSPGGVITGRVALADGRPLEAAEVIAVHVGANPSESGESSRGKGVLSDDSGTYRIWGLSPGNYQILAVPPQGARGGRTASEIDSPGASERLLGRPVPQGDSGRVALPPTFYPGTSEPSGAMPIEVRVGEVVPGVDIKISALNLRQIVGRIHGATGLDDPGALVNIEPTNHALARQRVSHRMPVRADSSGEFRIPDVLPGEYKVSVTGTLPTASEGFGRIDDTTTWAASVVRVTDSDVDDVVLVPTPTRVLVGVVHSSDAAASDSVAGLRITVRDLDSPHDGFNSGPPFGGNLSRSTTVERDGTFAIRGIRPGNFELVFGSGGTTPDGWYVQAVIHNGRDLRDAPLTFEQGSVSGVVVTVSKTPSGVSGFLRSPPGIPATGYHVVVFPTDLALWHSKSPRVRIVRAAEDGWYEVKGIPPGTYRLAVVADLAESQAWDISFFRSLIDESISVKTEDGRMSNLDIEVRDEYFDSRVGDPHTSGIFVSDLLPTWLLVDVRAAGGMAWWRDNCAAR